MLRASIWVLHISIKITNRKMLLKDIIAVFVALGAAMHNRYSDYLRAERLRGSKFGSRGSQIVDFSISSRPALGSTQPGALSPGVKGGKSVLLTTQPNYVPKSKNVNLYIRVPNTSFVMSCLTQNLCTGTFFTLFI
jgi:hypothetical protein